MAGFDRIAAIAGLICAVVVFGVAQLWRPPALVLDQLGAPEEHFPRAETPRIALSAHPIRAGEPFADPTKIAAALDMPGGGFQVETDAGGGYLVATDRRALEKLAAEVGAGRDAILAVGPLEKAGIVKWRGFVLDKTAVVAPGDVEEARLVPAPADGEASVSVGLSAPGRERALAYGSTHGGTPVALVMDGVVVRVGTTKDIVQDGRIAIAPSRGGFEDATRIAARLGGAVQPTPMWALQSARLIPALLVGFLVMSVFVIARRQR